ncbi:DNA primase/polymerase [Arthrobacter phage Djungelskog]|nr:DNA primase/polymerase [Arthrobacter phage Djungelskog]
MDFLRIKERSSKNGVVEVYPDFLVRRSEDLMVRGNSFYAIWDDAKGLWSTDEYDVQRIVDAELQAYKEKLEKRNEGVVQVKFMGDFSSNSWTTFHNYVKHMSDSARSLDENLTFANTVVKKSDYVSKRLPYPLAPGDCSSFLEIINTLYDPLEAEKILWAIGAVVSGDSKKIQKFMVWYGAPGAGKGTVLDIIQKLFVGYTSTFEAATLTGAGAFAVEAFKGNPLIAIDPDGDLSKITDNTRLNSIVSHEPMQINEKYKPTYTDVIHAFLLVATNKPVKFTDAKSGLVRRMIDIRPSGALLSPHRYRKLTAQIDFELGAIAHHCLEKYKEMGRDKYSGYKPLEMILQTDVFFNYIEAHYDLFEAQNGVSLKQAHDMWKEWVKETETEWKMPQYKLREELKNYFANYEDRAVVDNVRIRSWYSDFNADRFKEPVKDKEDPKAFTLIIDETESLLDSLYTDQPAQYSKADGTPAKFWSDKPKLNSKGEEYTPKPSQVVTTKLSDIDTTKEHYVKPPENHIVIDFDLTDRDGNKSLERNLAAASSWPSTYAELSKSGSGVHLHYIWDGDASELSRLYDEGIEVKVFTGDSSLRRRLSKCNNVPIATINSGLPLKEKKVINADSVKSEKGLRDLIERNLRKEIMPGTKPSIDFIHKILKDANDSGLSYDVTDMRPRVLAFANNSSHQAAYCIRKAMDMKWQSDAEVPAVSVAETVENDELVFFDCEVFPNLFVISYKFEDSPNVVRMINPTAHQVREVIEKLKLAGFNCRGYDNHILYAASMGYTLIQLYNLSKRIINGDPGAKFGSAYNISYVDVFDYASLKKGLKKWQIELGLPHDELGLDWDEPVPEHLWDRVAEYCDNDVITLELIHKHLKGDYTARLILAALSGLPVNETTQKHTAKIIFGDDVKTAKEKFVYTDLSEMFPGYKYEFGKSTYKGVEVGEGGLVNAEPGMHSNVALLDVASMHPASIRALKAFGPYTDRFGDIVDARLAIKHKNWDKASTMLGGALAPYLEDKDQAKALAYALKIAVNIVYGMTSASFDNPFRDPRNKDNIVAKRGALFMVDLKEYVESLGFKVIHTKTDSIKIPGATKEVIAKVFAFGKKYGYDFEHEYTYEKMALVNDAVYAAKIGWAPDPSEIGKWTFTGKQFQVPYVSKTLFTHEPITFKDKTIECHVKKGAIYVDFTSVEEGLLEPYSQDEKMHFVGKGGRFTPITPGKGGGQLVRVMDPDADKHAAVQGTKGWYWLESEMVETLGKEEDIDTSYFETLVNEALDNLKKHGDVEWFLDGSDYVDKVLLQSA